MPSVELWQIMNVVKIHCYTSVFMTIGENTEKLNPTNYFVAFVEAQIVIIFFVTLIDSLGNHHRKVIVGCNPFEMRHVCPHSHELYS